MATGGGKRQKNLNISLTMSDLNILNVLSIPNENN